jgi:hypothetical protein
LATIAVMLAMPRLPRFASTLSLSLSASALAAAALLAACKPRSPGPSAPTGPTAVPIPDGPGCPAAAQVLVAVYREATDGVAATWTLPLGNRSSVETAPRFAPLDEAAVAAASLPAPPAKLWLVAPGAPPCEATPGAWYSDTVVDGEPNDVLGVQLTTSCAAPAKDQPLQLIAVAADAAPTGCVAIVPRPIAGRVGEAKDSSWQIVPQSTPLPPALEGALPQKKCGAPCEKLWTASQLDFAGKPIAWDVALEWLGVDPAQPDVCQWTSDREGGLWYADAGGAAVPLDHQKAQAPLHLGALLADRSGPKVLVLEHVGEYATFDVGAGAPQQARYLRWYAPNPEVYAGDRKLGPYCGP